MTEDRIQAECVLKYNNKYCLKTIPLENRCLLLAIPNGGFRNKIEAVKLKSTGLLPGASDIFIHHVPHNKVYWTELKTTEAYAKSNHGMSKEQIEFKQRVEALGYTYLLFHTVKDFCLFFGI